MARNDGTRSLEMKKIGSILQFFHDRRPEICGNMLEI